MSTFALDSLSGGGLALLAVLLFTMAVFFREIARVVPSSAEDGDKVADVGRGRATAPADASDGRTAEPAAAGPVVGTDGARAIGPDDDAADPGGTTDRGGAEAVGAEASGAEADDAEAVDAEAVDAGAEAKGDAAENEAEPSIDGRDEGHEPDAEAEAASAPDSAARIAAVPDAKAPESAAPEPEASTPDAEAGAEEASTPAADEAAAFEPEPSEPEAAATEVFRPAAGPAPGPDAGPSGPEGAEVSEPDAGAAAAGIPRSAAGKGVRPDAGQSESEAAGVPETAFDTGVDGASNAVAVPDIEPVPDAEPIESGARGVPQSTADRVAGTDAEEGVAERVAPEGATGATPVGAPSGSSGASDDDRSEHEPRYIWSPDMLEDDGDAPPAATPASPSRQGFLDRVSPRRDDDDSRDELDGHFGQFDNMSVFSEITADGPAALAHLDRGPPKQKRSLKARVTKGIRRTLSNNALASSIKRTMSSNSLARQEGGTQDQGSRKGSLKSSFKRTMSSGSLAALRGSS